MKQEDMNRFLRTDPFNPLRALEETKVQPHVLPDEGDTQPMSAVTYIPPVVIKYRFYDFIDRTWQGYTDAGAHGMTYDQATRHVPQFTKDLNRLAYLVHEQKPDVSPFEALLVVLLNSGE